MSGPRADAGPFCPVADLERPEVDEAALHHLLRVRRLSEGAPVVMVDGAGGWRPGRVRGRGIDPCGPLEQVPKPSRPVTVAFPPIKGERPEWTVQKLTEVGVDRILLISTRRTVVRWSGDRAERQLDRLRRVAAEAVLQCRRLYRPEIEGVVSVGQLMGAEGVGAADPRGESPFPELSTVLIGPEGGWDPDELPVGVRRVRLADPVLRVETAALVAGGLLTALRAEIVVHHAE